jgi:hypothetical protein
MDAREGGINGGNDMAMTTIPLETAATMIGKAVKVEVEHAITEAIHSHIDPLIKTIAAEKAEQICENARVVMQRDVMSPDRMHVIIQFNGETFKDTDLGA